MEKNINSSKNSERIFEGLNEDRNNNEELISNDLKATSFFRKYRIKILISCSIVIIGLIIFLFIYFSEKNDEDKCELENCLICKKNKCYSCIIGYKLYEGKCYVNYSFKSIYYTSENNSNINLIYEDYVEKIEEIYIDGKKVNSTKNYTFSNHGNHSVYILINISNSISLKNLFMGIENIKSIYFSEIFDTKNIINMANMFFNCLSLTSINFSNFNTENVKDMSFMFYNCISLTSVNCTNFNTQNVQNMQHMFEQCSSLTSIDILNFKIVFFS